MFLSLIQSLKTLAKEASSVAQESGETVITERHIQLVEKVKYSCICLSVPVLADSKYA